MRWGGRKVPSSSSTLNPKFPLCPLQSADVAMSPDVPAARKVLSLLGFTVGKWLLPWTGGEENLEGAAIASCRPYASGGSCCIPGQTVPHHGTPGHCSSAPESSAAQVSSQGHLSMGLTLLCITAWQPTAVVDLGSLCGLRRGKILQLQDSHVLEWLAAGTRWLGFFFFFFTKSRL